MKIQQFSLIMLCMVGMTVFQSCSDDKDDTPELPALESNINLDGNGGSETINFTPKGLKDISFTNDECADATTSFFTADGTELSSDRNMADVAKIVYAAPPFTLTVNIKGDKLTITSLDNACLNDLHVTMSLDYGYTMQRAEITVTNGYPMNIANIDYDWDNAETGTEKTLTEKMTANNYGDTPTTVTVNPLYDTWSTVRIIPVPYQSWMQYVTGFINVPWYVGDKWSLNTGETVGIYLNEAISYHSAADPKDASVTLDLQPHSTLKFQVEVIYQYVSVPFTTTVIQPNSKTEWPINGTCLVRQPYSWNVIIE